MQAVAGSLNASLLSWRNGLFFLAIILMNYTLGRPSPVDLVFISCLLMTPFIRQTVSVNFCIYLVIVVLWTSSFYTSSIYLLSSRDVQFELLAKTFVVVLSVTACFVSTSWRRPQWEAFLKVYVASCTIGGLLGIAGFVTGHELLTWDGRAKGLIDDPNMYAAFLLPGVLASLYLLKAGGNRWILSMALIIIATGVFCAFSRVAVVSMVLCSSVYLFLINRHRLVETALIVLALMVVGILLLFVLIQVVPGFEEKLLNRLTFQKSYDAGHGGRYNRYALSLPLILANPLGIGINQIMRYFPEPLHNLVLGSFLYYGWLAGFAMVLLIALSIRVAWRAYRLTREPLAVLLNFSVVSILLCAFLHEAEHWRHMWLFFGLLWGFNPAHFPMATPARPEMVTSTGRADAQGLAPA